MIKCKITVTTSLATYERNYTANDLDHAWKKVQTDYIKGDAFVFQEVKKRIHVPRHAVLEVMVEDLG